MGGIGKGVPSTDAIAAHAQKLAEAAVSAGRIAPDGEGAVANATAALPSFSAGTIAVDPDTGRPTTPASAPTALDSTETVALDDADANAGAAAEAALAGKKAAKPAASDKQRDDKGKFVPDKPIAKTSTAPVTPAAKDAAVEDKAAQILDEWADAAELTFEHDDGSKYTVRAKKAEAKQVERFNRRQAQADRAANYLGKYRQTLEPLILSGQLDAIQPIINRALVDKPFGEFIAQAFNRHLSGLPLNAAPTPAPMQQQAPPAAAVPQPFTPPAIEDPYIAEQLRPFFDQFGQIAQQNTQLQNRLSDWETQQRTLAQQQAARQQEQRQREEAVKTGHQWLAFDHPDRFKGDLVADKAEFDRVWRYATDGGYVNGDPNNMVMGMRLAAQRYYADRAEMGSPAAEIINHVDQATLRAAQAQAASARAVSGSGGTVATQRKVAPTPPARKDASGKMKPIQQYMDEVQAYRASLES